MNVNHPPCSLIGCKSKAKKQSIKAFYTNPKRLQKFSKVGGRPEWFQSSKEGIITRDKILCEKCKKQMKFLVQFNYPIPKDTVMSTYIYCCSNSNCMTKIHKRALKVFSRRLNRQTLEKYAEVNKEMKNLPTYFPDCTCFLCGNASLGKCGGCLKYGYCSKLHRNIHWKGRHQQQCQGGKKKKGGPGLEKQWKKALTIIRFPEQYLDFKMEKFIEKKEEKLDKFSHEEAKTEIQKYLKENPGIKLSSDQDLDKMISGMMTTDTDPFFEYFESRINSTPNGLVRLLVYNGKLLKDVDQRLWYLKPSDIDQKYSPVCSVCQKECTPVIQILPTLLNSLGLEGTLLDFDFGTIIIYDCIAEHLENQNGFYDNSILLQEGDSANIDIQQIASQYQQMALQQSKMKKKNK